MSPQMLKETNEGYPDEPTYNEGSGTCDEREAQKKRLRGPEFV